MKLKFRKAFSLLCAISMLLTSIPFLVISEESVDGIEVPANLPEQLSQRAEEADQVLPADEESADNVPVTDSSVVEEVAEEEPEQAVIDIPDETVQEDISDEPDTTVPTEETQDPVTTEEQTEEENGIEPTQESEESIPEFEEESAENVVEFEQEQAQAIQEVELTVTSQTTEVEQGTDKQQEETAETNQYDHNEEETVTTNEMDVTVSEEIWADYVTTVSPEGSNVTIWNVNGDLEAGKETVIRIISTADAKLYFQLTSGSELEAELTDENNENKELFTQDENEEANTLEYSLNAVHFAEGGSQLIHILPVSNDSFELQILTAVAWAAQQNMEVLEEDVQQAATVEEEKQTENTEESTEEQQPEADTAEEETEPEEIPVFELDEDTLVRYNGEDENVIVPDGIKEIGSHAFYGNGTIKTVTLPVSVEIINNAAFADCANLEKVILSEQNQLVIIGNGAFKNDTKLDVSFAENVPNILTNAFEGITAEEIAEETAEDKTTDEEDEETENTEDNEGTETIEDSEETEETEEEEETVENQLFFEGEDFTVTVTYSEDAQLPEGTELSVLEILPETEEYEAYFSLTDEERAAIWNAVAEEGRLFLITLYCNEEEVTPAVPIQVQVVFAEAEILWAESPMVFEGEDFTVTVTFGEDVQFPEGTELTVQEILPETEEYEAYFSLTDEERSAIWNAVAEGERLFLISFIYNEEEIIPQASIDVTVTLAQPEVLYLEAGQMIFEGEDFIVTVDFGDDAQFPVGTELNVREILPETPEYALYSGMTDEALNEDWAEITLERYFDIAFMANGEELEPKGFVDVQISFHEKIKQNEETEIQAVHIENNEANIIEVGTDSTKVAVEDEEAIDTVTFTSDSFSVYGVVQKKKIITKTLVAGGNTYEIEVTYGQEAEIPENAEVKVEEIPEGSELWDAYRKQTTAALKAYDVQLPGLYDISIIDETGEKVTLQAPVSVAFKMIREGNINQDLQVVHFKEEMPQELVETAAPEEPSEIKDENTEEQTEVQNVMQIEVQSQSNELNQTIESETITAIVEGDTVTFDTQSFSVYAFAYTVDFYYEVNGENIEFHIPGGTVQSLRELLQILKIAEDDPETENNEVEMFINFIDTVTFSNESLVKVVRVNESTTIGDIIDALSKEIVYSGNLTENEISEMRVKEILAPDWSLVSLNPFQSEEQLSIVMKNGQVIIIKVKDALGTGEDVDNYIGKKVIIYDYTENRAMTSIWEQNQWRTEFASVPLDGADNNEKALWTIESNNSAYYLKSYDGNYLKIRDNSIYLVGSQAEATPLNIQRGGNPDYQIKDKNNSNIILTYCDNSSYPGFFSSPYTNAQGTTRNWFYIKEADPRKKKFAVEVATWTSNSIACGKISSKYFGNGSSGEGTRYPKNTNQYIHCDDNGTLKWGFGASPNTGYQFAFWAYQENGKYRQIKEVSNNTMVPFDETKFEAFFTPQDKRLFIYQSEDNSKGTVNKDFGYSDDQTGVTATPNSGYQFIGWFNENQLVSMDPVFLPSSVSKSMVLTAKFTVARPVNITISVNSDNGQPAGDVVYYSNQESCLGNQQTNNNGKLLQTITAKSTVEGYDFYYWTLNGKRILEDSPVLSNDPEDEYPVPVFREGDHLQAVFLRSTTIDASGNAYSTIHVGPDKQQQFERWINALVNNEPLDVDKSAKVSDYDNRIYQIDINAKSVRVKPDANIGIAFILDASGSMRFPANLVKTDTTMVLTQDNLNREFPDESGPLYFISDPTQTSTVFRLYKEDGLWYAVDASYYDDATVLRSRYYVDWDTYYTDWANSDKVPLAYPIYRDAGNGTQRIQYLNQGLNGTVNTLHSIVDQISQISGSTYDIKVAYTMFAAYTKRQHKEGDTPKSGFEWVDFTSLKNNTNFTVSMTDTDGGTRQDLGLSDALAFNWDSIAAGQRYAILITDGAAVIGGSGSTWDGKNYQGVQDNIKAQANALKAKGVTLITVGLSTQNVVGGSNVMSVIASPYNSNNTLFFEAGNGNDLQNIMYEIVQTVVKNGTSCGQVVDEVDEAFYPVQADGTPVEPGYYNNQGQKITQAEYEALAPWNSRYKWEVNNGKWTITWENQYIGWNPVASDSRMQPWNGTFYVKAKENFLGGNTISTNSGVCKVVEDGYTYDDVLTTNPGNWTLHGVSKPEAALPVPYVNVDELAFTENHTEWTVYLGTEVDPLSQLKNLYKKIDILKVVSGSTNEMITNKNQMLGEKSATDSERFSLSDIITLSDEDWASLIIGNTVTKPYDDYGHTNVGTIQISLTKNHDVNKHITETVETHVEQYTLSVTYVPTEESEPTDGWHTTLGGTHGAKTNIMESNNNKHEINVFVKGLKIEKKDDKNQIINNGTAKFKLYRNAKSGETDTLQLTVGEERVIVKQYGEELSTSNGLLTIDHLPYGTDGIYYLVETVAPEGYTLDPTPKIIRINLDNSYWAWNQKENLNNKITVLTDEIKPYNWKQTIGSVTYNGTEIAQETNGYYGPIVVTNEPAKASFDILKVKGNTTEPLTGAIFQLEQKQTDEIYSVIKNNIAVDGNGHAEITGLENGEYLIRETQAPAGYNILSAPITFTVVNGKVNYTEVTGDLITYTSADQREGTDHGLFTIGNTPGVELPSTGGSGTIAYTLAGLTLILFAGAVWGWNKRRNLRERE